MKTRWFYSLATKTTVLVALGTSLVLAAVLTYGYRSSRDIIEYQAGQSLLNLAKSTAVRMELELRSVAEVAGNLAAVLETDRLDAVTLDALIRRNVQDHPAVFGSAVAFEPFSFVSGVKAYAPYFFQQQNGISFIDLATESYDYFHRDWYSVPREIGKPMWSPPYFDEGGGNVVMTTYSQPFFRPHSSAERQIWGIVTADVSVEWLTKELSTVQAGKTGYCFLISETGVFLAHPEKNFIMQESVFSLAEENNLPGLRETGKRMLSSDSGFIDMGESIDKKQLFLGFARLPSTGWSLGVIYPRDELFSEISMLYRTNVMLAVAGLFALLAVSVLLARSVTSPLRKIAEAASRVAAGDLNYDLPATHGRDEVGELARAFKNMTVDLKKYIQDLTVTTAAKERIESELGVAASIQKSMLPSKFPDREDFDIYAVMDPAKEVGGDFYQFLLVDSDRLFVAIGDVSGKGVPAALLMTVATSLIRSAAAEGQAPHSVLEHLNNHLVPGNDSCMFVTVFCGMLDLKTGALTYANGGHERPLIVRADGHIASLSPPGGPVLGIMDGMEFAEEQIVLEPGDCLISFTDGVTEAMNTNDELYSRDRLISCLDGSKGVTAHFVTAKVLDSVSTFATGAPQADDITVLAVKFNGRRH
ncbi:SpoIIE family protein phosphatase [Desulfomonile tiedjei]|uniref:HAMP domain-containing protein,cache domain-containing protein n=1 Tax=Desulfomonile tiedjei (strain ATCC 49306 / DSM 6799 / DCB-1) TaxID=706587 RepID=I4CAE8_DESTA|nr:SpoIIE family protein phosphatase [Desulfomonile tiedjei]AFM26539.1 HAMP domain-containing protein,cache domain-containing protein [Desulfomonile tiedjei DSM 6799]